MRDYESLSGKEVISKEEAIFYDALEIGDDGEREAFLREACGKRRTLRVAVENLLSSHQRAMNSFARAAPF